MKKRIISLLVAFATVMLIPVFATAADTSELELSLSSTTACEGGTASIDIIISNNPGFAAMTPLLTFDKDVLSFVIPEEDTEKGGYKGVTLMPGYDVLYGDLNDGKQQFGIVTKSVTKKITTTGHLINLTFKVADGVPNGDYEVNLGFRYNTCNVDEKVVPTVVTAHGKITVTDHTYGTAYSNNKSSHWRICRHCGKKEPEENHIFDNDCDTTCNVCTYTRIINHSYSKDYLTDGTSHWHECSSCHLKKDKGDHTFDDNCDTDCNVCGYTRNAPHEFSDTWNVDETSHWQKCSGCGETQNFGTHIFGEDLKCEICNCKKFKYGDINDDGLIDNRDLVRFNKYLSGQSVEMPDFAADITGDGETNDRDIVRLKKYLAGQSVVFGIPKHSNPN